MLLNLGGHRTHLSQVFSDIVFSKYVLPLFPQYREIWIFSLHIVENWLLHVKLNSEVI
jgi:hypothetical protein